MARSELAVETHETHLLDHWCRKAVLSLVQHLPEGGLTLYENGQCILDIEDKHTHLRAEIRVRQPIFYRKVLLNGGIGAAESYIDGDWDSPNLLNVVRLFARNSEWLAKLNKRYAWLTWLRNKFQHMLRKNSKTQAKRNILAHYDLGNNLYQQFLDQNMLYSSGVFPHHDASLDEAQHYKMQLLCEKLQLKASDHLLEIGTGWGGLAIHAAQHYGCRVTTTTISEAQYAYTLQRIYQLGLQDQITLLKQDYRELTGQYDKLVSVEMIEAVGKAYLPNFFSRCNQLLKANGLMVLQAITIADQRYYTYSQNVDFIQKYIFPGGFLPSLEAMLQQVRQRSDLVVRHVEDIGLDYAHTLKLWWERFAANQMELRQHGYDERFARLWEYYLHYCEGGFRERTISTVQVLASKPEFLGKVYGNASTR